MPRNGSGTFTPTDGVRTGTDLFVQQRGAGVNVDADLFDAYGSDLASAVSASLAQDGQTSVTADLPMSGYKHTNVDDAAARNQYASAGQVQDGELYYASAGGTANAITVTLAPAITAYATGMKLRVKLTADNTGATTINANGVGVKTIKTPGGGALIGGELASGEVVELIYDGTDFIIQGIPPAPNGAWTPTITGVGDTIGSVSIEHSDYVQFGKIVFVVLRFTFATSSTSVTGVEFDAPAPVLYDNQLIGCNGRDASSGSTFITPMYCRTETTGDKIVVGKSDGTNFGNGGGRTVNIFGYYLAG